MLLFCNTSDHFEGSNFFSDIVLFLPRIKRGLHFKGERCGCEAFGAKRLVVDVAVSITSGTDVTSTSQYLVYCSPRSYPMQPWQPFNTMLYTKISLTTEELVGNSDDTNISLSVSLNYSQRRKRTWVHIENQCTRTVSKGQRPACSVNFAPYSQEIKCYRQEQFHVLRTEKALSYFFLVFHWVDLFITDSNVKKD